MKERFERSANTKRLGGTYERIRSRVMDKPKGSLWTAWNIKTFEAKPSSTLFFVYASQNQILRGRAFVNTLDNPSLTGRAFVDILENPGLRGRAFVDAWASLGNTFEDGP